MLLLLLYTIFCYTPWMDDLETRFFIGYVTIGIVLSHLAINIYIMLSATTKDACHKTKLRRIKRKYKKDRLDLQNRLADTRLIRM